MFTKFSQYFEAQIFLNVNLQGIQLLTVMMDVYSITTRFGHFFLINLNNVFDKIINMPTCQCLIMTKVTW